MDAEGHSPPFCGKLAEDKGLELTLANKELEPEGGIRPKDQVAILQKALKDMVGNAKIPVTYDMNSAIKFPDPHNVSVLAHNAYKDTEKDMRFQDGWKLIATAVNRAKLNGYFGAAFMNPERHQIVIAHRGTKPLKLGAVWTDAIGVLFNNIPKQMESACTFSKTVGLAAKGVEDDLNIRFQFIFTGHSLGAWLAQITTFALKYLDIVDSKFQRAKCMSGRDHTHAHTVVFDSPGCRPMLLQMQDAFDLRHSGRSIDINQLDITTYLSAPNLVNTCCEHVGTLYRLNMDFSKMTLLEKYTLIYTLAVHAMAKIVTKLDPKNSNTLQEPELVADFPRLSIRSYLREKIRLPLRIVGIITMPYDLLKSVFVRQRKCLPKDDEWTNFFEWACHSNNYNPDVKTDDFINNVKDCQGYWPIRYQTELADSTRCGVNVFTLREQEFLKMYQMLKTFPIHRDKNLTFAVVDAADRKTLEDNFESYNINNDYIKSDNLQSFIPFVQQLLKWHPAILEAIKSQMSEYEVAKATYRIECEKFLSSWKKHLHLEYKDNMLEHCWHKQVWLVTAQDDKEMRTITRRIHSSYLGINTGNISDCTVLKLEQLLYINDRFVGLKDFVQFEQMTSHLFLIECEHMDVSHDNVQDLLRSILDDLQRKPRIRFIFITVEGDQLSQFLQQEYKEKLGDAFLKIAEEIKPTWEDLTPAAQKGLCEKKRIVFNGDCNVSLSDLVELPVEEMGKIVDCTTLSKLVNENIAVGRKPWNLHNSKATSIDLYADIHSQQIAWLLKHSGQNTIFLFSISGSKTDDILKRHLTDDEVINRIYTTEGWDSDSNEKKWRELCRNNQNKLLYWFQLTLDKIHCKQIYNPKFYIQRQFKIDFSSVMKSGDLFIISYNELDRNAVCELKRSHKDHCAMVVTEMKAERYVERLRRFVKQVHWIKADANQNLAWQQSIGPDDFTDCIKKSYLDENSLADVQDRLVIIAGEPGMGKSTTLTHLAEHLKDHWVIMRDLRSSEQKLKRMNDKPTITADDAIEFLSLGKNDGLSSDFAKALLKCGLQGETKKTLYLMFDGFDEIKDTVGQTFVKLILFLKNDCKCRIWITTRKNCKEELEKQLSTIAVNLEDIGCEQRQQFLDEIWRNQHEVSLQLNATHLGNLREYTQKILNKASDLLGSAKQSFLSSPLQLRMIAEAFCPEAEVIEKIIPNGVDVKINDKISLYQTFIERKYDIYLQDKAGLISNACQAPKQWCAKYLAKKHKILAFRMLYAEEIIKHPCNYIDEDLKKDIKDMNHVGLIQSEYSDLEYDFIHGSIADFFVAKLLAKWLNKPEGRRGKLAKLLMSSIIEEEQSKSVRFFLEEILKKTLVNKDSLVELCRPYIREKCQTKDDPILNKCCSILHVAAKEKLETIIEIMFACFKQNLEALINLISWRNHAGKTALYVAMEAGNDAVVSKLLEFVQEFPINAQEELLYATCYRTSEEIKNPVIAKLMEKLESSKMKKISDTIKKKWPHIATSMNVARRGDMEKIIQLFPVHCEHHEAVFQKYLIAAENKKRKTALHFAAMNGHESILSHLLQKGANPNAKDHLQNTPLHAAVENNREAAVKRLMENGADINIRNQSGKTPLDIANEGLRRLMVKEETNAMSKPELDKMVHEFCMKPQKTNEIIGCSGPKQEEFKTYVFSYRDKNNSTPLHIASMHGNTAAVKWLSNLGLDLNVKDTWGQTPLHRAAKRNHAEVVEVLKTFGAIPEHKDNARKKASQPTTGKDQVAKVRQSAIADDLDAEILEVAAEFRLFDLAKTMIKNGVNTNELPDKHKSNILKYVTGHHGIDDNNLDKSHVSVDKAIALNSDSIGKVIALNNVDLLNYLIDETRIQRASGKGFMANMQPWNAVEWHNLSKTMQARLHEKPFSVDLDRKPPTITLHKYADGRFVLQD